MKKAGGCNSVVEHPCVPTPQFFGKHYSLGFHFDFLLIFTGTVLMIHEFFPVREKIKGNTIVKVSDIFFLALR